MQRSVNSETKAKMNAEHDYLRRNVDPVIMPMIEKLILHQPENIFEFMQKHLSGDPLGPARYASPRGGRGMPTARRRKMADFMAEKVLPVIENFTYKVVTERPAHVKDFVKQLVSVEVSSNQEAVEVPQAQMVNENQGPSKVNSVLLLIGIDGAGKSTLLSSLQGDLEKEHSPSIGFSSVSFEHAGGKTSFYDLGGGPSIRNVWQEYYADAHGIIFVVDSSDQYHIEEAKKVIQAVLKDSTMAGKPLLLYANKQDKADAVPAKDLPGLLAINHLKSALKTVPCVAKASESNNVLDERLEVGLMWLFEQIEKNYQVLAERVDRDTNKKKLAYTAKIEAQRARVQVSMEKRECDQMALEDKSIHQAAKVEEEPQVDDSGPKCNNCHKMPATTRNAASKWTPVCEPCLAIMKSRA